MSISSPTDLSAYALLVRRLADMAPRNGYVGVSHISPLSDEDVCTVLRHENVLIRDAFASDARSNALLMVLSVPLMASERAVRVGRLVCTAVEVECREYLMHDVNEEIDRREIEAQRATRTDQQIQTHEAGVASLFRE